jgi:Flp pilus assembly protein TadG
MKKPKLRERGATLAETAIVMSVLLAMLFGILDFGRALYTYSFVAQAARQGARWAMVRGANCTQLDHCPAQSGSGDIQPYVQSLSAGATDPNTLTANLNFPSCGNTNARGCIAQVTVTYPFNFMLPFLPAAQLNISSTSEMVITN